MLRFRTVLMMLLFTAIGEAASRTQAGFEYKLFFVLPILGALFIHVTTINDIADEEIDKINLSSDLSRPLVTSHTKRSDLLILSFLALFIAFIGAFIIRPTLILFVAITPILSYIYSMPPMRISYRGILASLLLPLIYVAIPYGMGIYLHPKAVTSENIILLLGLYVSFIGRIILKDFRDVKGDKKFGKLTFLVRYGAYTTCEAAGIAWVIGDLILINLYTHTEPFLVILLQPLVIAILFTLYKLAHEKYVPCQLTLVNLIGRLGNSIALCVLAMLTLRLQQHSIFGKDILLLLIFCMGIYTSYYVYALYNWQVKNEKSHAISQ